MPSIHSEDRATRTAVFVGVARNCAKSLPGVFANLERFSASYDEAAFVFVVSDSTDSTAAMLGAWTKNHRLSAVIDLGVLREQLPKRTVRLAHVRNACLAEVRRRGWDNYQQLVVVDLDNALDHPISGSDFQAAANWLDGATTRGGVFANSFPRYYDIWALRHDTWCPADCWHAIWTRDSSEPFDASKMREVHARQIAIPSWLSPIPVRSAFGGLGIYKMRHARSARYWVNANAELETSEHVSFNEQVWKAGGTLHIFPSLILQAPVEHLFQPSEMSVYLQLRMHRMEFDERRRLASHDRHESVRFLGLHGLLNDNEQSG